MIKTIGYLRADMERAKQEGASRLSISMVDLEEVLRAAESFQSRDTAEKAKRHAGWAKAGSIHQLRSGQKKIVSISRRKSEEYNVELYFGCDLKAKQQEFDAAMNARKAELEVLV